MWTILAAAETTVDVQVATDLRAEAQAARDSRLPILLAFSAIECFYCEELDEWFLKPMLLSGEYADKIIIRKLILDNGSHLRDFSGSTLAATDLALRYRVYVTPTILFLDRDGRELAERMVGINTIEMYGGYLDECIDTALLITRHPEQLTSRHGCRLGAEQPTGGLLQSGLE